MHHFGLLMHAGTLDENGNHASNEIKNGGNVHSCTSMTQEDINAATTDIVFGTRYILLSLKNSNTWDL
jgi:hypothetical protein